MPLTLEPAVKPGSPSRNITHEDFVDQLDRIDPAQTPLTSFCANAVELQSTDRKWTVDSFPSAKGARGRADGEAVASSNIRDWTANMRPIGNIGQAFDEQFGAGWIAQRIPRIADVKDPVAYAKASAFLMLKQHMEVAFSSFDQVAVVDQGTGLGSIGAGYRKLTDYANRYTSASAFALGKPSDIHYAPTGACLSGALSAVHSRAMWKNVAYALRVAAKKNTTWTLIAGLGLRQAVTDLTEPAQATTTVTAGGTASSPTNVRVVTRGEQDNILGSTVDVIVTDYGRIMVVDTDYIGTTTTTSSGGAVSGVNSASADRATVAFVSQPNAGLILERGNVFKVWGVTPYAEQLGKDGSGDSYDAKCFAMLGVNNPIRAGWLNLT